MSDQKKEKVKTAKPDAPSQTKKDNARVHKDNMLGDITKERKYLSDEIVKTALAVDIEERS